METEKIISFFKTNWLKITIGIVVVVVVYYLVRKLKQNSDDRAARNEYVRTSQAIQNAGGRSAQLTTTQAANVAKRIGDALVMESTWYNPVTWGGTYEEELLLAYKAIPTAADYYNVKAAFQTKYSADMWDETVRDLTINDEWYGQIDSYLNLIALPVEMR